MSIATFGGPFTYRTPSGQRTPLYGGRPKPKKKKAGGDTWTPTPAPRPAGAPPSGPTPDAMPFDSGYEAQVGAANTQYDVTSAGLQYQEGRIKQDFGFQDMSDPYARARQLERSYLQGQSGTLNRNASAGQLYSGANQRQLDEGTYSYNRDREGLRRQEQDALQGLAQQRAQAGVDRSSATAAAAGDRLTRAIDSRAATPYVAPKKKHNKHKHKKKKGKATHDSWSG